MIKKIKKILIISMAFTMPSIAQDLNEFQFNTSPVELTKSINKEKVGDPIDYSKLTEAGYKNYKNEILNMDQGKWNYLKGKKNVLIATNKENEVGIIKVHYSFKDNETMNRYRESLAKRYPDNRDDILRKGRIVISKGIDFNIDYKTYGSYLNSIILEVDKELSSDRLRYENKVLFIEINRKTKSSIESYMDFKISPQWNKSRRSNHINSLKRIKNEMQIELKNTSDEDLNSKELMQKLIKDKNIHIFK